MREPEFNDVHESPAADFLKRSLRDDDSRIDVVGAANVGGRLYTVKLVRKSALFPLKRCRDWRPSFISPSALREMLSRFSVPARTFFSVAARFRWFSGLKTLPTRTTVLVRPRKGPSLDPAGTGVPVRQHRSGRDQARLTRRNVPFTGGASSAIDGGEMAYIHSDRPWWWDGKRWQPPPLQLVTLPPGWSARPPGLCQCFLCRNAPRRPDGDPFDSGGSSSGAGL